MSVKSEHDAALDVIKTKEKKRYDIYCNSGKSFDIFIKI